LSCAHLKEAGDPAPLAPWEGGCPECAHAGLTDWVHLRVCLTCGYVGCCDSSPRRHMSQHHDETGHPVMRSYEPGETWRWCYPHQMLG
jgi:uncharacterized UBP type Zn finger protein